jgi:hypothetical protein
MTLPTGCRNTWTRRLRPFMTAPSQPSCSKRLAASSLFGLSARSLFPPRRHRLVLQSDRWLNDEDKYERNRSYCLWPPTARLMRDSLGGTEGRRCSLTRACWYSGAPI